MTVLQDWKFWLFLVALLNMGLSTFSFVIIKFNDFKHLGDAFDKFEKSVVSQLKQVNNRLGRVEKSQYARDKLCEERHKK